jgi:hypothetical protein
VTERVHGWNGHVKFFRFPSLQCDLRARWTPEEKRGGRRLNGRLGFLAVRYHASATLKISVTSNGRRRASGV